MRQKLFIFAFLLSVISYGQNWNVFNKSYRYNYKFDNSALISNVLFADTVKQTGTDTTYIMNNIGVVTGSIVLINKPQFLMKKIIKEANGNVKLQDTTNITIIPTCTLNQSWLFVSNYNLTATCVITSMELLFNTIDSVKTILVNNVDTIKLSKQFGIIQFPKLYGQNKYYRLAGIENRAQYDSIPLYGEKVPNAWDFYRFNVGDKYCLDFQAGGHGSSMQWWAECKFVTRYIYSKVINSAMYSYNVFEVGRSKNWGWNAIQSAWAFCASPPPINSGWHVPISSGNIAENYANLNQPSRIENRMYPGMVVASPYMMNNNVTEFGVDNHGTFYKYYGSPCQTSGFTTLPYASASNYGDKLWFGVGLGKINDYPLGFEHFSSYCVTSFYKINENITYFGPFYSVGLEEKEVNVDNNNLFPNPASSRLMLPVKIGMVKIFDTFGKILKSELIQETSSMDISDLPNGVYQVEIQNDSFKSTQKLIIQH